MLAVSSGSLTPGDTVDVTFEEMRKLVDRAVEGDDAIGHMTACLLTMRLPLHVCKQVLLKCGKDIVPTGVVACTKQLMVVHSPPAQGLSMVTGSRGESKAAVVASNIDTHPGQSSWQKGQSIHKCFRCQLPGHLACDCTAEPLPATLCSLRKQGCRAATGVR